MHALPLGFSKFNLSDPPPSCARWKDNMPAARDSSTFRLYIEARRIWRSKIEWQLTRNEAERILSDVSKAAELGDWGARSLMAHFYLDGLGVLESNRVLDADPKKAVEIQRTAAEAGQPWGLYDLGVAYEYGYGGVPQDTVIAWSYYLRAAKLGSPEAQMALASAYRNAGRFEDEATMLRCAYSQEFGKAAYELGMIAKVQERFKDAIIYFQQGVKFGSEDCAAILWRLFEVGHWPRPTEKEQEALRALRISVDTERSERYRVISEALKVNPDLKLRRLDLVLPLPPDEVPTWSGVSDATEPEWSDPPTY